MTKLTKFVALLLLCFVSIANAQENGVAQNTRTIKGMVMDTDEYPLSGAIVQVINTNTSVITSYDGKFEIKVPYAAKEIEVSMNGYFNSKANIDGTFIIVKLEIDKKGAAKAKAEKEARLKAEAAAKAKAEEEAEAAAKAKAEEKARLKAEAAAKAKAEKEARLKAEAAAKAKAEEEARLKAEAATKAKAEEKARLKAEAAAKAKAEEEARLKAEVAAKEANIIGQEMIKEQPARMLHADTLLNKTNTVDNIILIDDNNESYTFSEGQLGEDEDFSGTTAMISSNDDYFLSEVGYRFSAMRFRVRAYESQYNNVYANGVLLNDAERGQFSYGMIGGLNDATRNKEGATYTEHNNFGIGSVGGASNINMRASQYAAGHKASLVGCNRNYLARVMYTGSTGLMQNGWAFTGSASYRWANEGVIEGTFYNSAAYFLAAEKKFNDSHSLSIATWGSPTERAQQGAATEEAYWLAGSHYYNPNWGYQQGKKRNARVVNSYEPAMIITWDYNINDKMKLTTSLFGKYSMYSTSALGWNGNAADPRPHYYQNLPSAAYDVWDLNYSPTEDELADYNTRKESWTASKANRQLNWDYMYYANQQANAVGGECLYYVERRHNDQLTFNLGSSLNIEYNRYNKGTVGLQLGTTKGMHYKTMDDLMGAKKYTDIDKFSVGDFGMNSSYVQNDVDNPNRDIKEGDIFGYNYDLNVNKATLFYQHQFNKGIFHLFGGAHVDGTTMERYGHMRNGRAQQYSKGSSGTATFLGGGAKLGMVFTFDAYNNLSIGGGYENRAPLAYNSFIAPRMRNDFVIGLTNEDIFNAEIAYNLNIGPVSAKISGYGTMINNGVEQSAFYNDQESQFTYLTMTGVNKLHYGLEAAVVYNITSSLSINALASVGNAEYTDNANGLLISENEAVWKNDLVYMKGVKLDGTPLTAASLGIDYNIKGWYLSANVNYYDRIYIDASKYARLSEVVGAPEIDATTGEERLNIPSQYKGKGGFIVDASIGKSISLRGGKKLNLNLQLSNLLNNTNMITGGYEQNRGDSYADGEARTYKFSKNPYLYYANAFNFYLNIGFRF